MPVHLLIAGGGIGGLTAALALAQPGRRIDLLEQAADFTEVGAGVQLGPNATRRLRALGLSAALDAVAALPDALVVRSAADGAELARLPLGDTLAVRYGAPYLCVHRADLQGLLLHAVRASGAAALHTGARVEQLQAGDRQVVVTSARPAAGTVTRDEAGPRTGDVTSARAAARAVTGDEPGPRTRTWEADALVGADGLWSTVRLAVGAAAPPRATGHSAWRGLIEQAVLPPALRLRNVEVWLGPRLHAVAYPVRAGRALNVVVLAEAAPAGDARDWDQASSLAALQQATGRCGASGLQALLEAVPGWRAWTLNDRPPLAGPAGMARGRVALLGDAAHPMLPYLAQGAGMAIEDALALGDALGECGPDAVPAAFARYAQARWQRNAQVQRRARRNGEVFHATGALRLGRDAALRLLGARLLDQPWLYAG